MLLGRPQPLITIKPSLRLRVPIRRLPAFPATAAGTPAHQRNAIAVTPVTLLRLPIPIMLRITLTTTARRVTRPLPGLRAASTTALPVSF